MTDLAARADHVKAIVEAAGGQVLALRIEIPFELSHGMTATLWEQGRFVPGIHDRHFRDGIDGQDFYIYDVDLQAYGITFGSTGAQAITAQTKPG